MENPLFYPSAGKIPIVESSGNSIDPALRGNSDGKQTIGFYEYYHILRAPGKDDDESEEYGSGRKGELKGYMDGLHSPWGLLGQVREKTGYTLNYILWGEPWINFLLGSMDAPRYVKGERPAPVAETVTDIQNVLGSKITIL